STSDLLIANCDEFIYYDDLVREQSKPRRQSRKKAQGADAAQGHAAGEAKEEDKKQQAFDMVLATIDALVAERGAEDKIWGSMVKQALKRQRPYFNETYYGFRSFNKFLEQAPERRLLPPHPAPKPCAYLVPRP